MEALTAREVVAMTSDITIRWRMRAALALATLIAIAALFAAACGGSSGPVTTSAAATPSPSTPQWNYVVIGDSALCGPDDLTVADTQARLIKRDVGAEATVDWYFFPGSTSADVLDQLRYSESLREAIRSAEVVLFDIPEGQIKETCPWDMMDYRPRRAGPERWRKSLERMLVDYRRDAKDIVNEIVSLRSPDEASIRALVVWQMFLPTFRKMGLETVIRQEARRLNQAVEQACAARGVTVVDGYTAFMGRDGRTDPVAAGDVLPDQMHLSDKGITKLAALLHKKGYAEIVQTP
jgi:hypothetical protein